MGLPTRPSTKGYTPVPVEERIDDGVESPQHEAEDDEDLYPTSAPLLSGRSRGNEPPPTIKRPRWYHKIGTWRPFCQSRHYASWDPPRKPRTWRQIIMFSLLGVLILSVIAFATATGVLAQETRSCNRGYNYQPRQNIYNSHVLLGNNYASSNGRLNFPRLYPPIKPSSSACEAAWASLYSIPCHEKIWNRSWDNGKHNSLFDPDVGVYAEAICETRCITAIKKAHQIISSQCTEEDKFDMADYFGTFSTDPGLEDGPLGVMTTIAKRVGHTCWQKPPTPSYWDNWNKDPYCVFVMWENWFIVDGMNAGNLEGLEAFEKRTRTTRSEPKKYKWHTFSDTCDSVSVSYGQRYIDRRKYGPSVNSTTCDWCTINWFERKLLSWKKDEVKDPKTGDIVSLPEYLNRIRHAGERCEADAWNRAWGKAVRKYKSSGDLPDDWEKDRTTDHIQVEAKPDTMDKLDDDDVDADGFFHASPEHRQVSTW
ncbi:hypothetical protein K505DRAFT_325834 [Melanomma pulvis-pyrius CBS 109.77]|uniref:Uncharacterized protein n=1 Tax=Melanomma pulvis-pyrius CBS 109.77 TaxID=1314802 RepID=A0A6A6X9T5_9PLEO|nr:hypothetical protein K505DRAFT_325834 [Melanomma pulvis-pyrius CBS 109.77]